MTWLALHTEVTCEFEGYHEQAQLAYVARAYAKFERDRVRRKALRKESYAVDKLRRVVYRFDGLPMLNHCACGKSFGTEEGLRAHGFYCKRESDQ